MNKLKSLIIVFVFVLTLPAFSQQVVNDTTYKFQITIPQNWKVSKGGTVIPVFGYYDAYTSVSVTVTKHESFRKETITESQIDTLKTDVEKMFSKMFKGFKTIDYGMTTISGHNAFYIIYNYNVPKNILYFSQYMFYEEDKQFFIAVGCADSEKENYSEQLKNIVNSFTFVK